MIDFKKGGMYVNSIESIIKNEIIAMVNGSGNGIVYREPLIGFADAGSNAFQDLKRIVAPDHLLPSDLLKEAKSVVSFFLPFSEGVVKKNRDDSYVSKDWAIAYIETNKYIDVIIQHIKGLLEEMGIKCSDNPARMHFDQERLIHIWSQRHVARICGLGNFGINNMLITDIGCAGRYGSFVIDAVLPYDEYIEDEYCLYKRDGSCAACIKACPTGALSVEGFDRYKCYEWVKKVDEHYSDLEECEVCGKCIAVPCAFTRPCK